MPVNGSIDTPMYPRHTQVLSHNANGNCNHNSEKSQKTSKSTLRRMSNSLIVPQRFRKKKSSVRKKTNGTNVSAVSAVNSRQSASSSQKSLRFEIEEEVRDSKASSFERFCHCTSLHGWKYLSSSVNFTLRIGWVGVVLAAMGVAAFFLGYCFNDFVSSTVQTTQDTSR